MKVLQNNFIKGVAHQSSILPLPPYFNRLKTPPNFSGKWFNLITKKHEFKVKVNSWATQGWPWAALSCSVVLLLLRTASALPHPTPPRPKTPKQFWARDPEIQAQTLFFPILMMGGGGAGGRLLTGGWDCCDYPADKLFMILYLYIYLGNSSRVHNIMI